MTTKLIANYSKRLPGYSIHQFAVSVDCAITMLDSAVTGIAESLFLPAPGMQCGWCRYRQECMRSEGGAP